MMTLTSYLVVTVYCRQPCVDYNPGIVKWLSVHIPHPVAKSMEIKGSSPETAVSMRVSNLIGGQLMAG
jgi:hypothetical protein